MDDMRVSKVQTRKYAAEPSADFSNENNKKKISLFGGDQVAYMPQGGIGALLNGSQSQPTQSAVQA